MSNIFTSNLLIFFIQSSNSKKISAQYNGTTYTFVEAVPEYLRCNKCRKLPVDPHRAHGLLFCELCIKRYRQSCSDSNCGIHEPPTKKQMRTWRSSVQIQRWVVSGWGFWESLVIIASFVLKRRCHAHTVILVALRRCYVKNWRSWRQGSNKALGLCNENYYGDENNWRFH